MLGLITLIVMTTTLILNVFLIYKIKSDNARIDKINKRIEKASKGVPRGLEGPKGLEAPEGWTEKEENKNE